MRDHRPRIRQSIYSPGPDSGSASRMPPQTWFLEIREACPRWLCFQAIVLNLDAIGWVLAVAASLIFGLSKTTVAGAGILGVAIFAQLLPARESTGAVLPLLIVGDIIAVLVFRRHANWRELWRVFPLAALGVIVGTLLLGRIDDLSVKRLVGAILVVVIALEVIRRARGTVLNIQSPWLAGIVGALAGFTTMIANAAGPIMTTYLLAMRLPKLEFVGTGAWFYLSVNLFKVPFGVGLGIINPESLVFDARLAPVVIAGALIGLPLVRRLNQVWFERIALLFAFLGGLRLLVS